MQTIIFWSIQVRISTSSESSSSSTTIFGSSSSSLYARRYLPSRNERRQTAASATCSVQSTPICSRANASTITYSKAISRMEGRTPGISGVDAKQQFSGRRWTFFEIGKTPRGAPRGLTVPYMYTKRNSKTVWLYVKMLIKNIQNAKKC